MPYKYSYSQVYKIFEQNGCLLLSTEYINCSSPLEYICCCCGNRAITILERFLAGKRCQNCKKIRLIGNKRSFKHGKSYNKSFNCWRNIKDRCNNPKNHAYKYYGGRGIKCLITLEEVEFLWQRDNANLMNKPSIDRINNDGDYTFENCRFIELKENVKKGSKSIK